MGYPKAKVLLNVRDPVKWVQSVNNSIRQIDTFFNSWLGLPLKAINWVRRSDQTVAAQFTGKAPTYLGAKYPRGMFGVFESGDETAVRFFNDWIEQVKSEVPADRLLVFQVR